MALETKQRVIASIWIPLAAAAAALAALKVSGQIAWPWWLVMVPLWIIPAMLAAILMFVALLCAIRPITVMPARWLLRRFGRRR